LIKNDRPTQHIHNGWQSAINKMIMNKLTDIAIMNKSAKNTATVHMRDRCVLLKNMSFPENG